MTVLLYSPSYKPPPPIDDLWWDEYQAMPRQVAEWTCSACSLAWVERATFVNSGATEQSATDEIGYPNNINPTWGLMDGSGTQLKRVLDGYGLNTYKLAYPSFDQLCELAKTQTGAMSGYNWYHWVAIRGYTDETPGVLYIANSAPGYHGAYSTLSREQYNSLGSFQCVMVSR
jgi:hypothetical protein